MGTYSDSKFRKANKRHYCGECREIIPRGQRYLVYKYGYRNDGKFCIDCALVIKPASEGWGGGPKYDCAVVRKELGMPSLRSEK